MMMGSLPVVAVTVFFFAMAGKITCCICERKKIIAIEQKTLEIQPSSLT
jgi:hypothetical protein